jgi:hypothetical protein
MPRKLTDHDLHILRELVPELGDERCEYAGHDYLSILPPVSQHFSHSAEDFRDRIGRLSDEELEYIVEMIFDGLEELVCLKPEHLEVFVEIVAERLSKDRAEELIEFLMAFG